MAVAGNASNAVAAGRGNPLVVACGDHIVSIGCAEGVAELHDSRQGRQMFSQTGERKSIPPTIMVISEEPVMLSLFTYALRDQGYEVCGIKDGLAGMEQWFVAPPNILIVQHRMVNIDALKICRHIRSDPKLCNLPILVFQVIHERDVEPMLLAGATACFGWPFDIGDILARIITICTEGRP